MPTTPSHPARPGRGGSEEASTDAAAEGAAHEEHDPERPDADPARAKPGGADPNASVSRTRSDEILSSAREFAKGGGGGDGEEPETPAARAGARPGNEDTLLNEPIFYSSLVLILPTLFQVFLVLNPFAPCGGPAAATAAKCRNETLASDPEWVARHRVEVAAWAGLYLVLAAAGLSFVPGCCTLPCSLRRMRRSRAARPETARRAGFAAETLAVAGMLAGFAVLVVTTFMLVPVDNPLLWIWFLIAVVLLAPAIAYMTWDLWPCSRARWAAATEAATAPGAGA